MIIVLKPPFPAVSPQGLHLSSRSSHSGQRRSRSGHSGQGAAAPVKAQPFRPIRDIRSLPTKFFLDIKARTSLGSKLTVPVHSSLGVFRPKFSHQPPQRILLRLGARVHRLAAAALQSTDIADAYRVLVVPHAVRTLLAYRTANVHAAVEMYNIVVAATVPPLSAVPAVDVLHRKIPPCRRGRAVDNEFLDRSHKIPIKKFNIK